MQGLRKDKIRFWVKLEMCYYGYRSKFLKNLHYHSLEIFFPFINFICTLTSPLNSKRRSPKLLLIQILLEFGSNLMKMAQITIPENVVFCIFHFSLSLLLRPSVLNTLKDYYSLLNYVNCTTQIQYYLSVMFCLPQ